MTPPIVARPWIGTPQFGDFAVYYRRAGAALFSSCLGDHEALDALALPTLYLYRHALELAIKDAVLWAEAAVDFASGRLSAPAVPPHGHRLDLLADRLLLALRSLETRGGGERARLCEAELAPALLALVGLDASGQRFRYPEETPQQGGGATPDGRYDLAIVPDAIEPTLKFVLEDLGSWLEGVVELLAEDAQIAHEWTGLLTRYRMNEMWGQWIGVDQQIDDGVADDERAIESIRLLDTDDDEVE